MAEPLATLERPAAAIVVGASGGIGAALVARLAAARFDVHALSRRPVPGAGEAMSGIIDVTDEASVVAACADLGRPPPLRLVVIASGLLHDVGLVPEKSLRALDGARLARSFAVNAIGPALVAKHLVPLLPHQGKSVFVVLSARVGSIGDNRLGGWYGYRASKAALNQIMRTLAVEVARTHPEAIIVALHPGTVATTLSAPFRAHVDPEALFTADVAANHLLAVIEGLTPADSGGFFAWDDSAIPF